MLGWARTLATSCVAQMVLLCVAHAQQPTDLESLLASAQQAQARGNFQAAANDYAQASALHPEIAELKANLGLMDFEAGKYDEAAGAFRQALRLKPELLVPNLFLGLDDVKLKRFNEAIPYLKRAAQLKPDEIHAQLGLGEAYSGQGETRLAIRSFRRATETKPQDADAWYRLGVAYLEQVEVDARVLLTRYKDSAYLQTLRADSFAEKRAWNQAAETYKRALMLPAVPPGAHARYAFVLLYLRDLSGAERELKLEIASTPGSLLARLGMARLQVEQGSIEQGAKQIADIWNADAGFLTINAQRFKTGLAQPSGEALQSALGELQTAGELSQEAVALFQPEAAEAPVPTPRSDAAPWSGAGRPRSGAAELYGKGKYRQCDDLLASRIATLSPKDLQLFAVCAYSTGDYAHAFDASDKLAGGPADLEGLYWEIKASQELAAEALTHAGKIDSGSPEMHVLLGDIYRQQEAYAESEQEYRKALSLRPEDTGALFGLSLSLLGDGKIDDALQVAQPAVKDHPDDPELNAVMGEILSERAEYSEAEAYLKKSLNTKPEYVSHVHALLGKVYANTNRAQEAIAELKLALPEDRDGALYFQLGRLYREIGDLDSAQRAFTISKRLESEHLIRAAVSLKQNEPDPVSP